MMMKSLVNMETASVVLFLILGTLMFWLLIRHQLDYMTRRKRPDQPTGKAMISSIIALTIISFLVYYFLAVTHVCSWDNVMISGIISLLLLIIAYLRLKKHTALSKLSGLNCAITAFALCTLLNMGIVFFCRWFLPDVTTVERRADRWDVTSVYAWPFTGGFKPTDSYIVNDTKDTLYRVVVSYAFLGEEVNNHYNVTDTIAPMTTANIPCPPNFVARSILPIMMPSHGRFGRTRARRSYIATKKELDAFETGDFRYLGIKSNIRINSFNITSNPIVWESPERISVLENTIKRMKHY